MRRIALTSFVVGGLALAQLHVAGETARFRHLATVYFDDKGGGLNLPEAVACGLDGQFVVGDTANDRLLRFAFRDRTVTGGSEIAIGRVSAPSIIQLTSKGEIYALDGKQRRIVRLSAQGEYKDALGFEAVPAPSTIVPKDFAIDTADNVYVLDVFSGRVLVLNPEGQFQKALPLPEGTGSGARMAVDSVGSVLVLDTVKRRLFSAAKDANAFEPIGGDLTQFVATLPTYMTTSKGVIFVVEGIGSSIVGFGRDGSFLARQLSPGWADGSLNYPSQMCINDKDEVFIADRDNSRVQVFQLVR